MDWLAVGKAISDIGGWAAFLGLIVLIAIAGMRRWWVFGWMYDRSEAAREASDNQAERNSDSLASQSKAIEGLATSYDRLERDVARLPRGGDRD